MAARRRRLASAVETLEPRMVMAAELGLRADYYNAPSSVFAASSIAVTATPALTRTDMGISSSWGAASPGPGVNADGFAVRWSGQIKPIESGTYTFRTTTDDGVRLWVNGQLLVDKWINQSSSAWTGSINLQANAMVDVRMDYFDASGDASARLEWQRPGSTTYRTVPASQLYPFSKPITITTGGTYVGSWESLDPNVNVINMGTTNPVSIQNSQIRGRTQSDLQGNGLIHFGGTFDTDLTVRNTQFLGMKPNVADGVQAHAINIVNPRRLTIENNAIEGTIGIRVLNFEEHPRADFIRVRYNEARNIDGRREDANGNYIEWKSRTRLSTGVQEEGSFGGNFLQFNSVYNQPNVEVAWNQVTNEPFISFVEDNFSFYQSGGTAASPMLVHNNIVRGGYLNDPTRTGTVNDGTYEYDYAPTGTAMQINDNAAGLDAGYIKVYNNQALNTLNGGITLSSGHNIQIYENRVVSSAQLADGGLLRGSFTGMYAWDFYGLGPTRFYNNVVRDNVVGWNSVDGDDNIFRRDYVFAEPGIAFVPRSTPPNGVTWTNNLSLPGTVTRATEATEWNSWRSKVASNAITVGLLSAPRHYAQRSGNAVVTQAELYDQSSGVYNNGEIVGYADAGDWIRFRTFDFGGGMDAVTALVGTELSGSAIELRSGSPTGTLLGRINVPNTGSFEANRLVRTTLTGASGRKDLYLVFTGAVNLDWFSFQVGTQPIATIIGTTGSRQNSGNTRAKAFDNRMDTFFDAPESTNGNGAWVGQDLGTARRIRSVEFAPRIGFANRMIGGRIQVSNTADFSSGVTTLLTLDVAPPEGILSSFAISNTNTFRYIRFLSPNSGWGNIAELVVWT
jgi:hypothetical protein